MDKSVAARLGDMGEGTKLQLLREEDGDIIVCVMPAGHRLPDMEVQFCIPGNGGGTSPRTWAALLELFYAMQEDQIKHPHAIPGV